MKNQPDWEQTQDRDQNQNQNQDQDRDRNRDGIETKTDDSPPDHRPRQCPDCDTTLTASQSDTPPHCPACGLIVERQLQTAAIASGAEISDQQHPQDQVTTQTRLNTTVGSTGPGLPHSQRINRLRNRQTEANYHGTQYLLAYGCQEILRIGGQLGLPDSAEKTSARLLTTAQETDNIAPYSIEAMAGATIYASLRIHDVPRTRDEIADVAKVSLAKIHNASNELNRRLSLELPPPRATTYVDRFADKIESTCDVTLTTASRRHARTLLAHAAHTHTCGKKPAVLAAASLYAASYLTQTDLSIRDVATGCRVSSDAVTTRYPPLLAAHPAISISVTDITETRSRNKLQTRLPVLESQTTLPPTHP